MNLFDAIRRSYATYLLTHFGDVLGVDTADLPAFGAYMVRGELVILAGALSDTDFGRVWKAADVYSKDYGYVAHYRTAA